MLNPNESWDSTVLRLTQLHFKNAWLNSQKDYIIEISFFTCISYRISRDQILKSWECVSKSCFLLYLFLFYTEAVGSLSFTKSPKFFLTFNPHELSSLPPSFLVHYPSPSILLIWHHIQRQTDTHTHTDNQTSSIATFLSVRNKKWPQFFMLLYIHTICNMILYLLFWT